jgi:hypothetical protein
MSTDYKNPEFRQRLAELIGEEKPFTWAKRLGINSTTFTRMWKEGSIPSANHLILIREKTGVDLNWLLTGERDETSQNKMGIPDYANAYGDDFIFSMYDMAKSLCEDESSGGYTIPLTKEERSTLTAYLCEIFSKYHSRLTAEDAAEWEIEKAVERHEERLEETEEEYIERIEEERE